MQPSGRISAILSSAGPLQIVIPRKSAQFLSAATRLAHSLNVYYKLDSNILDAEEAQASLQGGSLGTGNIVVIGDENNVFLDGLLTDGRTPWRLRGGKLTLNGRSLKDGLSAMFLHPHPISSEGLTLVMYAESGLDLERILRLFPLRTGLAIPDWIIVSKRADVTGAGGVEGAG